MTAHSASLMSEGYRRARVLRDPAGQHRQAMPLPGCEGALSRGTRYKAIKGSWCGRGVDTTPATRSPLPRRRPTRTKDPKDHEVLQAKQLAAPQVPKQALRLGSPGRPAGRIVSPAAAPGTCQIAC